MSTDRGGGDRIRSWLGSMVIFALSFVFGVVVAFVVFGVLFRWAGDSGLLGGSTRGDGLGSGYQHQVLFGISIAIVPTVLAVSCRWVSKRTGLPLAAILGLATGMLGVCVLIGSM